MTETTAPTPPAPAEPEQHAIVLSSWLYKRAKSHSWQKRWCVLRRNQLAYYKDSKEYKASRVIPAQDILSFSEIPDSNKWHFIVVTSYRVFHLRAQDKETYLKWAQALDQVVRSNEQVEGRDRENSSLQHEVYDDDDDEDQVGDGEVETFSPTKRIITHDCDSIDHDLQNFHFSGTDDNFTSGGLSDTGSNPGRSPGALLNNHSSVSLGYFNEKEMIPTSIPEENEDLTSHHHDDDDHHHKRTVYFNSFSSTSPEHIIDSGYLYRLKKRYKQWKKYYLTLTNHYLYFYKNSKDFENNKVYKSINVDEIIDCVELDPLSRSRVFCMLIVTPKKRIRFCADSEDELTKWLVLLKTIVKTRKDEKEDVSKH
ncbi:CYFA0S25e01596g1_1 [Cyberlindnera fabianii]|uniref:CYFA0S25e01596g1_1 n=1 Tax=Cyberlindnera fabianii TaxID=36022 RepID=A0A061BFT0_CYBFA|nr:CYFA0S25e01596g1_1 [Cyberlindnera fabianii]